MNVLLPVLIAVATVMGTGMIVPQAVRLHRTGRTEGVSGAWIGLSLAMNAWWIAYALAMGLWGLLPVSTGAVVLYALIAARYGQLTGTTGTAAMAAGFVGFGAVPAVALLAGGWGPTGLAMGLAYAVQFSPAALTAVRASDLSGIAPATWAMALVEAAIWFTYGAAVGDHALLVGGGGGALTSLIILVRLWVVRRPSSAVAQEAVPG